MADVAAAAADSDNIRFDVYEIRVGGNTVLEKRAIEAAVYPHLGPQRSFDDVEAARAALTAAYQQAGYNAALVSIPEQTVDQGIVRLDVQEGVLGRVRVSEARYVSGRDIRAALPSAEPGSPINFDDFQQDLTAVNNVSPDRSVTPIIRSGRKPGEVELELRVQDELPLHASFDLNDRFTADTEELRATFGLSYDNLFQRFHSLSLQYTTAPERTEDTEVWALTYLARFENSPALVALYAVDTASDVATVGDLNVLGDGRIYGFRYVRPLQASGGFFHTATLGLDNKNITETIGETLNTPIHYTHASAGYRFGWAFEGYSSSYDIGVGFGVRAFGNDVQEFEDKRFNARPNYLYWNLGTEQLLRVPGGIGLYARLAGQYSAGPLINNEQLAAGGATTVRGYLEAERLGDYGAYTNLEVRTPNFGPALTASLESFYLFAFYDAAQLGLNDALPGQDPHFELYSGGVGLRLNTRGGWRVALDYAHPLRDSTNVQAGDERFHFQLKRNF